MHSHKHSNGRPDNLGTDTDIVDIDADGGTDPGIQQIQTEEQIT